MVQFQSTLPAGEATHPEEGSARILGYFNPRFPRGKRQPVNPHHAISKRFQSTLPAGEATNRFIRILVNLFISIHASRGGSDPKGGEGHGSQVISIHASRGGSDNNIVLSIQPSHGISIHASRGGSDLRGSRGDCPQKIFQSTLPAGEATKEGGKGDKTGAISIHASRGGSDEPAGESAGKIG